MSGIGVKPISKFGSERLIRAAINYALDARSRIGHAGAQGQHSEVHRGRLHEVGLRARARRVRRRRGRVERLRRQARLEAAWSRTSSPTSPSSRRSPAPSEFDVIATMNLNGDYLSDALAAQVGGIGIAPGANINYVTGHGIFEATHGTAPKYAGQDKVNPGSVLLSGVLDVRAPRLDRRRKRHRHRAGGDDRRQDRHLRLRATDGGRHGSEVFRVRRGDRRASRYQGES